MEETKEYHRRYLRAVNHPLRRKILRTLREEERTLEMLKSIMGLDAKTLKWHLNILQHGFCVEKEERRGITVYKLTQEGKIVDFVDS